MLVKQRGNETEMHNIGIVIVAQRWLFPVDHRLTVKVAGGSISLTETFFLGNNTMCRQENS